MVFGTKKKSPLGVGLGGLSKMFSIGGRGGGSGGGPGGGSGGRGFGQEGSRRGFLDKMIHKSFHRRSSSRNIVEDNRGNGPDGRRSSEPVVSNVEFAVTNDDIDKEEIVHFRKGRMDGMGQIAEDGTVMNTGTMRQSLSRSKRSAGGKSVKMDAKGSIVIMDQMAKLTPDVPDSSPSSENNANSASFLPDDSTRPQALANTTTPTRYRNVYAAPLEISADFEAPVHPKIDAHRAFIEIALEGNFVFSALPDRLLQVLVSAFEKITVDAGESIIVQGEVGDFFYLIQSGTVRFLVNGVDGATEVGHAYDGTGFGELALLYDLPRAATCQAVTACSLFRVDQKTFRNILASNSLKDDKEVFEVINSIPFLADLDKKYLNRIVAGLTTVNYNKGDSIFQKGDEGIAFYVVRRGNVGLTGIEVGGTTYADTMLTPGDYFGERAIVKKEPRVADATAVTDVTLLSLTSDDFVKIMGDFSDLIIKSADLTIMKNCNLFEEGTVEPWQFEAMVSLIEEVEFEEGHYFSKEGLKVGLPDTAIYFVRDGAITVSNTMGQMAELTSGAYFGESTLKMFWEAMQESSSSSVENMEPQILAPSTAYCMKDCKLGALSLSAIEAIMGTTSFHLKRATPFHNFKTVQKHWKAMDGIIQMSDIVKHSILGVGTFGKVWLVSKKLDAAAVKAKERRTVYALKIQNKTELLEHNQVNGVIREMNIMTSIDSPFIIKLYNTYQDERDIYMLIGLVQGGELFSVIHSPTRDNINEVDAKFYAAGILLGLEYMHSRHILYRDLKPENVLIDNKGYPVIVDLGFAKIVLDKTYTLCGTPLYLAPEVILSRGHDHGADHWSWAVLIYEMIVGITPFYDHGIDQIDLFRKVVRGHFIFPRAMMSAEARDIISHLLVVRSIDRLGSFARGAKEIKEHTWFDGYDFNALEQKKIAAPWVPKIRDPLDNTNFDNWDHMETGVSTMRLPTEEENARFRDF